LRKIYIHIAQLEHLKTKIVTIDIFLAILGGGNCGIAYWENEIYSEVSYNDEEVLTKPHNEESSMCTLL